MAQHGVVVIAHGNYKDQGCSFASAAAVCEAQAALAPSILAMADVAPALRRALLNADERIRDLATLPVEPPLQTYVGPRRTLLGIGASVLAAVITRDFVSIAHVGENRAVVVRDGRPRRLVVPHTMEYAPDARSFAESHGMDPSNVVIQVVGFGAMSIDVVRAPVASGDRLVFGNPGLGPLLDEPAERWLAPPQTFVERFAREAEERAKGLPPTVVVVDLTA
jgi:serine/threonine protein phosphatase PrpC